MTKIFTFSECLSLIMQKHQLTLTNLSTLIGSRADLVLIDRCSIHNMPCYDDYAMLAYSADRSDVLMTVVDGRILYRNGAYTCIDEERLKREAQEVFAHYFD